MLDRKIEKISNDCQTCVHFVFLLIEGLGLLSVSQSNGEPNPNARLLMSLLNASQTFRLLIDLLFNGFRSWLAEEYYLRLVLQQSSEIRSNIWLSYVPYGPIGTPIELVLSSNQLLSARQ